ncbi:MAG: hypothetical protein AAF773_17935, partial [Cyanobacteria bacterium P01_D01_bin.115]
GLARIKAKLATTAETSIAMTVLVMNLEQRLRALILFFGRLVLSLGGGLERSVESWLKWAIVLTLTHFLPEGRLFQQALGISTLRTASWS